MAPAARYLSGHRAPDRVPRDHGTGHHHLSTPPSQWKTWYWICFGGIIFFLLSIPLLRGRWKPSDARGDEQEHEAMVQTELAKLGS